MALKIFTSRPGIMIGYRGNMIDKYKPLIQEIYPQITSIEFEETDPDYLL